MAQLVLWAQLVQLVLLALAVLLDYLLLVQLVQLVRKGLGVQLALQVLGDYLA